MKISLIIILVIAFIACGCSDGEKLVVHLTSGNNDTIAEMENFYMTSITKRSKPVVFKNPKGISGSFTFEGLKPDIYIGLIQIKKNDVKYNITIDSIEIHKGINIVSKEINLDTVEL